jgi:hypothetical protein
MSISTPINKLMNNANPISINQMNKGKTTYFDISSKLFSLQISLAITEQINRTGIEMKNILNV